MSSNKLEMTKRDLMGKGEDYPLKTCIMEWVVLWNLAKNVLMWVLIFFFFFSFDLGFWLLLEAKSCFWARKTGPLILLHFLLL